MITEIEFVALPYPLPEVAAEDLKLLGQKAINARATCIARVAQTAEGQKLADFEADLRAAIGVVHRRPWIGHAAS